MAQVKFAFGKIRFFCHKKTGSLGVPQHPMVVCDSNVCWEHVAHVVPNLMPSNLMGHGHARVGVPMYCWSTRKQRSELSHNRTSCEQESPVVCRPDIQHGRTPIPMTPMLTGAASTKCWLATTGPCPLKRGHGTVPPRPKGSWSALQASVCDSR